MKKIAILFVLLLSCQTVLGQNSIIQKLDDTNDPANINDPANVIVEKPVTVQQLADLYSRQSEDLSAAEETTKRLTKALDSSETRVKKTEAKLAEMSSALDDLSKKLDTIMASTESLPEDQKEQVEARATEARESINELKASATQPVILPEEKTDNVPVLRISASVDPSIDTRKLAGYGLAGIGIFCIAYFIYCYKRKP